MLAEDDWDFEAMLSSTTAESSSKTQLRLPTPPPSQEGSPETENSSAATVSMSTTFLPGGVVGSTESQPPNFAFMTLDSVLFYVHSSVLQRQSTNHFDSLLLLITSNSDAVVPIKQKSEVMNVLLHSMYGLSCARYSPSFGTVQESVDIMHVYGLDPSNYVAPSLPLFSLLLSQAPLYPLAVYALAAQHGLHELAVSSSSNLLSLDLSTLSDEMSQKLGPTYLKKLFFLHLGRCDALKRYLVEPPHPHPPTDQCSFVDQRQLSTAWSLSAAYFAWEAKADISVGMLEGTMGALGAHLTCSDCKRVLQERIRNLVVQWTLVKRTI